MRRWPVRLRVRVPRQRDDCEDERMVSRAAAIRGCKIESHEAAGPVGKGLSTSMAFDLTSGLALTSFSAGLALRGEGAHELSIRSAADDTENSHLRRPQWGSGRTSLARSYR